MNPPGRQLFLKKNEEHRILNGHQWVFSNEVREVRGSPQAGDVVELLAANDKSLGVGFYNPHSLISARLLSSLVEEIDAQFLERRLTRAYDLRRKLYPASETCRLVHGESDFLPGLVVDKYNDYLSVQTFSYGMDARLGIICDILESLLHPTGIVERNESPLRDLEKLPQKKGILRGTVGPTTFEDGDIKFVIDALGGQKTGFFLDQRENRHAVRRFSPNAEVLDCFCNEGGFALHAAKAGAKSVLAIDSSSETITRAAENAALNNLKNIHFVRADVFAILKQLDSDGRQFDVVVLDPPSFT
jgi:23S rRNA (cytosine1962-C5)-methyltransferase